MPYLRLTADRRGVEHTFLLHVAAPGDKPKILYWYRTVPGVQVGRAALDDAAMRGLEEQYPDIDFDWTYILDVGAMTPVEVEAPIPQRKRKPAPRRPEADEDGDSPGDVPAPRHSADDQPGEGRTPAPPSASVGDSGPQVVAGDAAESIDDGPDLLSELLGRGIAASLRDRHADLFDSIEAASVDPAQKSAWHRRLAPMDPDAWQTPEAVLAGMNGAEREFERLQDELDRPTPGA